VRASLFLSLMLAVLWGLPAEAQSRSARERCIAMEGTGAERIDACSRAIASGLVTGRQLSVALTNRAASYTLMDQHALALADYDRAIEIDPRFVEARLQRAGFFVARGQPDQSMADLDRAVQLEPENADARRARGTTHQILGYAARAKGQIDLATAHYNGSLDDYGEAIRLSPSSWLGFYDRAVALEQLGQFEAAIADYNEILVRRPDEHMTYDVQVRRCKAGLRVGQLELALRDCTDALGYRFIDARPLLYRAAILLRQGNADAALQDIAASWRYYGDAQAMFVRGVARLRMGDVAGGERDIGMARAQDSAAVQEMVDLGVEP